MPDTSVTDVSTHATLRVATPPASFTHFLVIVSTHATLRVATAIALCCGIDELFQLTRPCGSRQTHQRYAAFIFWFQLTRPCGSRRSTAQNGNSFFGFNSRDPAGRDDEMAMSEQHALVSTHATLRVATVVTSTKPRPRQFQLTRPCGSRHSILILFDRGQQFQLTRPCGSRPLTASHPMGHCMFQLTRPCGSRHVSPFNS